MLLLDAPLHWIRNNFLLSNFSSNEVNDIWGLQFLWRLEMKVARRRQLRWRRNFSLCSMYRRMISAILCWCFELRKGGTSSSPLYSLLEEDVWWQVSVFCLSNVLATTCYHILDVNDLFHQEFSLFFYYYVTWYIGREDINQTYLIKTSIVTKEKETKNLFSWSLISTSAN